LLCVPGPVYFLIPLPAHIIRKEPAKLYKRLFWIARGAVLLLRALASLTCPCKPLTTHTLTCKTLSLLKAPPSLTPTRTLTHRALPSLPSLTPTCKAHPARLRALSSLTYARKVPFHISIAPTCIRKAPSLLEALPSLAPIHGGLPSLPGPILIRNPPTSRLASP
jgi:hypothetical protein